MKQYVLAVGNIADGIALYGPFTDAEEANHYGDHYFEDQDWVVMDLETLEEI
jgi:hypothetical protein